MGCQSRTLAARAAALAGLIVPRPAVDSYPVLFTETLLAQVPPHRLTSLFQDLHRRLGRCLHAEVVATRTARGGTVECRFDGGHRLEAAIALEGEGLQRIASLDLGEPQRLPRDVDDLWRAIGDLPGQVSLLLVPLTGEAMNPLISIGADTPLAMGSVFKLWVLCELTRSIEAGERQWSDVVAMEERHRGTATGMLHRWPAGTPLTVHTLASLMIALSDNTAADHLLALLGRDRILAMMQETGHQAVDRNLPFLATLDAARLKGDPTGERARRYVEAAVPERRRILAEELDGLAVGDLSHPGHPRHIDCLEWFASARDICRALDWLRHRPGSGADAEVARDILAINGGLPMSEQAWSYVGFKGGGEAGVMSAAYLLRRRRDGAWLALAGTWNDAAGRVDAESFFNVIRGALHIAAAGAVEG